MYKIKLNYANLSQNQTMNVFMLILKMTHFDKGDIYFENFPDLLR